MTKNETLWTVGMIGAVALLAAGLGVFKSGGTDPQEVVRVLPAYQRGESVQISFQNCSQNYGTCPAYDFTDDERTRIASALDTIPTDVLARSKIRRIAVVPGGPQHVQTYPNTDVLAVYVGDAVGRRYITDVLIKQIVDAIVASGTTASAQSVSEASVSGVSLGTEIVGASISQGAKTVVVGESTPVEYSSVIQDGIVGKTGQRVDDAHPVTSVLIKE